MGTGLRMTLAGAAALVGMSPIAAGAQTLASNLAPIVASPAPPAAMTTVSATPQSPSVLVAQAPAAAAPAAPPNCAGVSPYDNYQCLDAYLGDDIWDRLINYYKLEWGQAGPPSDPNSPTPRRAGWPTTPQTTPPMPFTEWPYGGANPIGVTLPNSIDSPLMVAIANTSVGEWMNENHLQLYGWIDPGFNVSSNTVRPGGNAPIAYSYTPNTVQLDQFVTYFERQADEVQQDHIDWGFRTSLIVGENYRYTTAYGIASYQLLKNNQVNGYDFPMMYADLYVPQLAPEGTTIRVGRFISVPDIEAQLAPNNYMYSHSMTYAYDNYTNQGILTVWGITKNFLLTAGAVVGTEAPPWHMYQTVTNPDPGNALYPGKTFYKDPGSMPSATACMRYTTDTGYDDINLCMDGINSGNWGYNNLQWYGGTYYHKFNEQWHLSWEAYTESEAHVPNALNPTAAAIVAAGGTPFSPQFMPFNAPNLAQCRSVTQLTCEARNIATVAYLNYSPDPLDNFSLRPEFFDDMQGQRTGVKAKYYGIGFGWQHWMSPQLEFRPEILYYYSADRPAFNGDSNAGIAPDKNYTVLGQMDMIFHF
jgi:hypothetical protein